MATVSPKISRVEIEFPVYNKVRVRLYANKVVEEDGEEPVKVAVAPIQAMFSADQTDVAAWLTYVLTKAKAKFGREDIVFDFPAEVEEEEEE